MNSKIVNKNSVVASLAEVKMAFQAGKLSSYAPLTASGSSKFNTTCTAAWGPLMRCH